jgi:hypothetical protein
MAKSKLKAKSKDTEKQDAKNLKRSNKLKSLKNEFEGNKIKSFDQVFAIMNETPLAEELNIPFLTFRKKTNYPGEFTVNELIKFAQLIDVQYEIISNFILNLTHYKRKV